VFKTIWRFELDLLAPGDVPEFTGIKKPLSSKDCEVWNHVVQRDIDSLSLMTASKLSVWFRGRKPVYFS